MGEPARAETPRDRPSKAKRRILDAAARLFHERGFARCTVRELADAVGILSGSLFHHFRSKDEILFAVMEEVVAEMDAELAEALAQATDTESRLRALVGTQLRFIHGPRGHATAVLMYEWGALSPQGRARLLEGRARYFQRWEDVLEEARQAGLTDTDPTVLRQLIHGAVVWTVNWFDPNGPMSVEDLEQAVLSLILK